MKSLDYRFSDQNTAVYPKKKPKSDRQQQKIDAAAYRQKILESRQGGLRSSAGALPVDVHALESSYEQETAALKGDVTKSPGFKREKQLDKQRKREKRLEKAKDEVDDGDDQKSSFLQCTFNMANILMVRKVK
jgi:hypothetical protein